MRRVSLVYPQEFSPLEESIEDEGELYMVPSTDGGYSIFLERSGTDLNGGSRDFTLRVASGRLGGEPLVRTKPDAYGYMPRNFSKPFEFMYKHNVTSDIVDLLGQSETTVREFKRFSVEDGTEVMKSPSFFSYEGELYYLAEDYRWHQDQYTGMVSLYKYQRNAGVFSLVHRFSEKPVDKNVLGRDYQYGSPVHYVWEGELYIAYRSLERNDENTFIRIYKADDTGLSGFSHFNDVLVPNPPEQTLDRFRMRAAVSNDAVMIVFYGVVTTSRSIGGGSTNVERQDMRCLVSYNGGFTWTFNSENYSSVLTTDGVEFYFSPTSNMAGMFVPEFPEQGTVSQMSGFSERFDLYYDKTMGSFVVLKTGDPDYSNNRSYLMGIKTHPNNYLIWENCLRYPLNHYATGRPKNEATIDIFEHNFDDEFDNGYNIYDVKVVPGDTTHTIFLIVENINSDGGSSYDDIQGVAVSEFRFVDKNQIAPGYYNKIFAYGGKYHEDYCFVGSLINKDQNGMISSGNEWSSPYYWRDLAACRHLGMPVAMAKFSQYSTYGFENKFFTLFNVYSNVGENWGYEMAHTRHFEDLCGLQQNTTASGSISYDTTSRSWLCSGNNADTAYFSVESGATSPEIMERASNSAPFIWKCRFQVKIENLASAQRVNILQAECGTASAGTSLVLKMYGTGRLAADDIDANNYGDLVTGLDLNNEYEFLVGYTYGRNKTYTGFCWYRVVGDLEWTFADTWTGTSPGAVSNQNLLLGLVATTDATGVDVYIGDVQVSSYNGQYRPTFSHSYKNSFENYTEGPVLYVATPANYDDPYNSPTVKMYGQDVELFDGSKIKITGNVSEIDSGVSWSYARSITRNSIRNVFNNTVQNCFEFTALKDVNDEYLVRFRNENQVAFDKLCLFNAFGIYEMDIKTGVYDEDLQTWGASASFTETFDYELLDVSALDGNKMLLNTSTYQPHELVNKQVFLFTTSGDPVQQFLVKENSEYVLEFDAALPTDANREWRLYPSDFVIDISDTYGSADATHVEINFKSAPTVSLLCLGEMVFGVEYDLSKEISELTKDTSSVEGIKESAYGLSFLERIDLGNYSEVFKYNAPGLRVNTGAPEKYSALFAGLHKSGKGLAILEEDDDGIVDSYYGILGVSPKITKAPFGYDVSFEFLRQRYYPKNVAFYSNAIPTLRLELDLAEVITGETITFTAQAFDYEGETVTFSWDFGDTNSDTGTSVTHSYVTAGEYTVTLTATDTYGNQATRSATVYVNNPQISYYTLTLPAGPYTTFTPYNVTITAKDKDGNTVTTDSQTIVWKGVGGDEWVWDVDGDVVYGEAIVDELKVLTNGVTTISTIFVTTGTFTIYVYDLNGKRGELEVTVA